MELKTKINAEPGKQELTITGNLIFRWNYSSKLMLNPGLLNNGCQILMPLQKC